MDRLTRRGQGACVASLAAAVMLAGAGRSSAGVIVYGYPYVSRGVIDRVPGTAPVADAAVAQTPHAAYLLGGRANGRTVSGIRVLAVF